MNFYLVRVFSRLTLAIILSKISLLTLLIMKTERISRFGSKCISLLRSDILNDLDASFYALDLKRETRNHVKFRTADFANDFNVTIKVDSL